MNLVNDNVEIIRLGDDIVCDCSITLNHDIYIIGEGHTFNLNDYSIFIDTDTIIKLESVIFRRGAPSIVQSKNSKLTLNYCSFIDCKITDEYKGSVLSTLDNENIVTDIDGCVILNSPHSIWHSDELTIDKLTAVYEDYKNIDTDYSMLLTMLDGIANIHNSKFKIMFDTNKLCKQHINMNYAQSLLSISESAQLNGITGDKLKSNNSLNYLFNDNSSNISCKYYYPRIESCVRVTPPLEFKEKACCHTVLGIDWVFKNNVEIRRV